MVTADEIATVAVLATLSPEECGRLSRAAADIRLAAGEYAVNEGDERALFAVLEGRIQVAKLVDGVERILGERLPGEIFGEVPITLGTPFPSAFRAAEASRVMRVAAADYHTLASAAPEVAVKVGALARERIGGLQGVAAEPAAPRALIVGHRWDASTAAPAPLPRAEPDHLPVGALDEGDDVEGPEAEALPVGADYPLVRFADGATVVRPALREVADRLGLATSPAHDEYDAVIVGAGPAGLAAAVYGASEGLRTLVVEREAPGGQAGTSSRIENYLGFPGGISGDELGGRALSQARRLGAEILVTRSIDGDRPVDTRGPPRRRRSRAARGR